MKRSYESKTLKLDLSEPRVFCFDIDGVIASIVSIQSYESRAHRTNNTAD